MATTDESKGQRRTEPQTGSSLQDQILRLLGHLYRWDRQKFTTDWTQTSNKKRWYQQSHYWAPFTNEPQNRLVLCQCITYSTNYYQRLTLESWFSNLEQTPLNRCLQLPAPYKRLIDNVNYTLTRMIIIYVRVLMTWLLGSNPLQWKVLYQLCRNAMERLRNRQQDHFKQDVAG